MKEILYKKIVKYSEYNTEAILPLIAATIYLLIGSYTKEAIFNSSIEEAFGIGFIFGLIVSGWLYFFYLAIPKKREVKYQRVK